MNIPANYSFPQYRSELDEKLSTVQHYQDFLTSLWVHLSQVIGTTSTRLIFSNARLQFLPEAFPFLRNIYTGPAGITLNFPAEELHTLPFNTLNQGLLIYTENVLTLVMDLTGEILIKSIDPEIETFMHTVRYTGSGQLNARE